MDLSNELAQIAETQAEKPKRKRAPGGGRKSTKPGHKPKTISPSPEIVAIVEAEIARLNANRKEGEHKANFTSVVEAAIRDCYRNSMGAVYMVGESE